MQGVAVAAANCNSIGKHSFRVSFEGSLRIHKHYNHVIYACGGWRTQDSSLGWMYKLIANKYIIFNTSIPVICRH